MSTFKFITIAVIVASLISCAKTQKDISAEESAVLASSTFYPGSALGADGSPTANADGGFIEGPGGSGSQVDGGSIPDPNAIPPSDGSTSSGGSSSVDPAPPIDTSSSSGTTDGSTSGGSSGSTDSSSTTSGGGSSTTDSGSTASNNPPSGNADGGTIPGGSPGSTSDTGTVPGGSTGSTSDSGGSSSGGSSSGSDTASNDNGGSTTGGGTGNTDTGSNTGGSGTANNDSSSGTGGGVADNSGGSSSDGGTIPGGSNTGGGDTGNAGGGTTSGGTTGGGSTGGGTADNNPPPTPAPNPGTDPNPDSNDDDPDSCGCHNDRPHKRCQRKRFVDVIFNRICSARRSLDPNFVFFEDAKNPVLSVEAMLPDHREHKCTRRPNQLASIGLSLPKSEPKDVHLVMQSVKLGCVDLQDGKFTHRMEVDPQALKEAFGKNLKKVKVVFSVCDDKNSDGQCSDEKPHNKVVVKDVVVPANRIPRNIPMEVWAGRHLTLANNPEFCEKQYSPLVIDVSGDGIALSGPVDKPVSFDLNDSGQAVRTGWTDEKDDAFLVYDVNGNGSIDSGAELFGSATRLKDGSRAANGFEALREFDSNRDNKVTARDADWKKLKLWLDKDHNGRSERRELLSLDKVNIEMISLDYVNIDEMDSHGNATRQRAVVHRKVKKQLKAHLIIDVWFNTLPMLQTAKREQGSPKVELCHVPPGNPANAHEIIVGAAAVAAHLEHGDYLGQCPKVCMRD